MHKFGVYNEKLGGVKEKKKNNNGVTVYLSLYRRACGR